MKHVPPVKMIFDGTTQQLEKRAMKGHPCILVMLQGLQTKVVVHPLLEIAGVRRKETVGMLPPHLDGLR
jgi:hypothetical protein